MGVVSPDGKLAANGASILETATGKKLCDLEKKGNSITHLGSFSPDGKLLAASVSRWQVNLYDSQSGKLVRSMDWPHENKELPTGGTACMDIAFMPNGKTLLASSHDTGIIYHFDVQSGIQLRRWIASPNRISNMKLSQDGSRLAVLESAKGCCEQGHFESWAKS